MKITESEFLELYSDKITKKRYDEIIAKIDLRFAEIMFVMCPALKRKGWFDYGNCNYDAEESGGYFDPENCEKVIEFAGENYTVPEPYESYRSFPTSWLWQDFEEEFHAEVQKFKDEKEQEKQTAKMKREALKVKKAEMRKIIESKLTKEELKFITFK